MAKSDRQILGGESPVQPCWMGFSAPTGLRVRGAALGTCDQRRLRGGAFMSIRVGKLQSGRPSYELRLRSRTTRGRMQELVPSQGAPVGVRQSAEVPFKSMYK
jgi:hypothetical protein